MIDIYKVINVPLGIVECCTHRPSRASEVFEKEIADPINRNCFIELRKNGVMVDHAGGLFERGSLVRAS